MTLFKNDVLAPDEWRILAAGEILPLEGKVILSLQQWEDQRAQVQTSNIPLGLRLEPNSIVRTIEHILSRFAILTVNFPKFTDGRGYSLAHQLRAAFNFTGELRATGDILFDQLQLLSRCGFDSFEIIDAATLKLLEAGRRPSFNQLYQPGLGSEVSESTRPWARRAAS
jgi:uncharacterized protein (DUF934 family)